MEYVRAEAELVNPVEPVSALGMPSGTTLGCVTNPLFLSASEVEAMRGLQMRPKRVNADDPVWDELQERGLVVLRRVLSDTDGSLTRVATLTSQGRRYPTY